MNPQSTGSSERILLAQHREHLYTSGLTDETIEAAGIYSVTDPREAGKLLNWDGAGPVPAIVFPHYDEDGNESFHVLRPDNPVERKNGSKPKYESPRGSGPRFYYPQPELVQSAVWKDVNKPVIVVEGIKKALASVQAGMPAISAQGVTVWHDIGYKKKTELWRLHPDFERAILKERRVYIAFDGGDTDHNPPVIQAEAVLAQMLLDAGADVRMLRIPAPGPKKVGLDDYLVEQENPEQALNELLERALPGDIMTRIRSLEDTEDPKVGGLQLLRNPSVPAALRVASRDTRDVVCSELLRICKITKASVEEKIYQFGQTFRTNVPNETTQEEKIDPEILKEAEWLLKQSDLVERLSHHFEAEGLVGEKTAATTVLLAGVSRLLPSPIHIVVKAASSSGKNYSVRIVVRCFPPDQVDEIMDMSPRALEYLEDGLKQKIVVIAEQEGAERAEYAMRIAMSEGTLSVWVAEPNKITGKVETRKHEVEGPACFITTTTRAKLHDENETRVLEVVLDESTEQTARILEAQARFASHPPTPSEIAALERKRKIIQVALSLIVPRSVRIPQAERLLKEFPIQHVRRRRDFSKLLALTSAHALLHQYQRKIDNETITTTDKDVQTAQQLCASLLSDVSPRLVELERRLREAFGDTNFTAKKAAKALGQDTDAVRRRLQELLDAESVEIAEEHKGNKPAEWKVVYDSPTLSDKSECRTEPFKKIEKSSVSDPHGVLIGEEINHY